MKIAVVYRVVQGWRIPVFERLSENRDFKLFYGCDFEGTKVVSAKGKYQFDSKKMFSFPFAIKKASGNMLMPFSPFLFFDLIKYNPDVVLCEGASNFLNNISIYLYCKLYKKPMVQWGLGEIRGRKKSVLRKLLDPLIVPIERRANAIVSYSTEGVKYYESIGIPKDKIFVAVNVIDTDKRNSEIESFEKLHKDDSKLTQSNFKILFVGALEENKNIEMLIHSFSKIQFQFDNTELHIIGDGAHRSVLENSVMLKDLDKVVTFHGRIQGQLIDKIYDMDVFVMPGLGGLAVSDMLCHGIPVICGVGDGCEADLINDKNGILDDSLNEIKLYDYLSQLILSPSLLSAMKVNARKTILTYNISNYIEKINAALQHAIEDKK